MSFVIPLEMDSAIGLVLEKAQELGTSIGERIGKDAVMAGCEPDEIDALLVLGLNDAAFTFGVLGVTPNLADICHRETRQFAKAAIEKFRLAAPAAGTA